MNFHPGHYLLLLSILCHLGAIIFWRPRIKEYLYITGSCSVIISFLLLEYAFITSDFSLQNVFFNSSSIIPLVYKISSAWSSHEGSMLLWLSMLSFMGILFIVKLSKIPKILKVESEILNNDDNPLESKIDDNSSPNTNPKASNVNSVSDDHSALSNMVTCAAFVQVLFCSFVVYSSNPFTLFTTKVTQGLGLNPMLQDTALAIHPPMLYLGYTSLYGCFLAIICILICASYKDSELFNIYISKLQNALFKLCRFFASIALTALTAGIGLGSWWAYRELGWSGYWFFDPVENISLLPWICAIIMHHSLIAVLKNQQLKKMASFFGLASFLITLYGFFFVRSGIISSVHSFAFSPERGAYIIAICLIITLLSLLLYFIKFRFLDIKFLDSDQDIPTNQNKPVNQDKCSKQSISNKMSSTYLISLGNILWSFALLVLLAAITYPIYYSIIWDIDIAIDPSYFHSVFLPLFIPILFLSGSAPILLRKYQAKKSTEISRNRKYQIILLLKVMSISLALASPIVIFILTSIDDKSIFNKCLTSSIIIICIYLMAASSYAFKNNISKSKLSISAKSISMLLGHFGAGLLGFSIAINTYLSSEVEFIGQKGGIVANDDLYVSLKNIKFAESPVYYRQIAEFDVQTHNTKLTLRPENRLYKVENSLSQEVDIYSFITHDLYAVLSKIDNDIITASISYKPMMIFIWLSVVLMSLGFGFLLIKK